ncbi:uncharacterized protein LOC129604083 [Betta splendens]|uniref:Uncharacterized protein LOC129604083 n=1 Tax=Betta splendens TaxID=158456 RepID=A0A9W2XSW2_BETSP|nr:uncharacterized protein LOC129604083 [Betta splendens]
MRSVDGNMSPVEVLMKEIQKCSHKWSKRTHESTSPWPSEGTFDLRQCAEMQGFIKTYKIKDKSVKRGLKRERENAVLQLFINCAKTMSKKTTQCGDNQFNQISITKSLSDASQMDAEETKPLRTKKPVHPVADLEGTDRAVKRDELLELPDIYLNTEKISIGNSCSESDLRDRAGRSLWAESDEESVCVGDERVNEVSDGLPLLVKEAKRQNLPWPSRPDQNDLTETVGLCNLSLEQITDHVIHAVELRQKQAKEAVKEATRQQRRKEGEKRERRMVSAQPASVPQTPPTPPGMATPQVMYILPGGWTRRPPMRRGGFPADKGRGTGGSHKGGVRCYCCGKTGHVRSHCFDWLRG